MRVPAVKALAEIVGVVPASLDFPPTRVSLWTRGCFAGIQLLFRPMLMHEATERGIVAYLKGIRYGGDGFPIP